jgi:cytochrome c peroxidase
MNFLALLILLMFGTAASSAQTAFELKGIFGASLPAPWLRERSLMEDRRIELGQLLYFDPRLSGRGQISCNSCHKASGFGVDGERFSLGDNGKATRRNSPSTFNAYLHGVQFWDGRAGSVEEQAKEPLLAAGEMGMGDETALVTRLRRIPGYRERFGAAFPDDGESLTLESVVRAIGAFQRMLSTPGRFDEFLDGNSEALTQVEQSGLVKFVMHGCANCHYENLVGGMKMQRLGLFEPWPNQNDQGRFEVTGDSNDRMLFKVASLRNVARTAPYFHDSLVDRLEEAIVLMGRHQLGKELIREDVDDIAAFLKSLTGAVPDWLTQDPILPGDPAASTE